MASPKKTDDVEQQDIVPVEGDDSPPDEVTPPSVDLSELTDSHNHQRAERTYGEMHTYNFADGSGAKVWAMTTGPAGLWAVSLLDTHGRGSTSRTRTGVATSEVNRMLDEAAEKADHSAAKAANN